LKSITYKQKLTEESFLNDFKDSWLKNYDYKFRKPLKFAYVTDEMIKVEIEKNVLQEAFNSVKGEIRKNLKMGAVLILRSIFSIVFIREMFPETIPPVRFCNCP